MGPGGKQTGSPHSYAVGVKHYLLALVVVLFAMVLAARLPLLGREMRVELAVARLVLVLEAEALERLGQM